MSLVALGSACAVSPKAGHEWWPTWWVRSGAGADKVAFLECVACGALTTDQPPCLSDLWSTRVVTVDIATMWKSRS